MAYIAFLRYGMAWHGAARAAGKGTTCFVRMRVSAEITPPFWMYGRSSVLLHPKQTLFSSFSALFRSLATVMSKPKCYFDITADGKSIGRIVMEVKKKSQFFYRVILIARHPWWAKNSLVWFLRVIFCFIFCLSQIRADVVPKTAGKIYLV